MQNKFKKIETYQLNVKEVKLGIYFFKIKNIAKFTTRPACPRQKFSIRKKVNIKNKNKKYIKKCMY